MKKHVFLLMGLAAFSAVRASGQEWRVVAAGRIGFVVLRDGTPAFSLKDYFNGIGWNNPRFEQTPTVDNAKVRVFEQKGLGFYSRGAEKPTGARIDLRIEIEHTAPSTLEIRLAAQPDSVTSFGNPNKGIGLGLVLPSSTYLEEGQCLLETTSGPKDLPFPTPPRSGWNDVKTLTLRTAQGEETRFTFEPPLFVHSDHGEVRLFPGESGEIQPGDTFHQTMVMQLSGKTAFEPGNRWIDTSDWMTYEHNDDFKPGSVIGMESWLEKPAGKHGWLKIDNDKFVFADGTLVKFYGVNISWDDMACPHEEADRWNDKWAKYGVNLVRLHKFLNPSWAGILTTQDHMVPDPNEIKLFDYYHASAKKRGIYLGWSPVFKMKLSPADKKRVLNYDEVMYVNPKQLIVYGLKNIAPDIQDLLIAQTVNLLNRKNTVTGIRYADDPALAYIELHNEDDIFFPYDNFENLEQSYPTYFKAFQQRFCQYLKKKYKTEQALKKAWGSSYPKGRTLEAKMIINDIDVGDDLLEEPEMQGDIRPHYPSAQIRDKITPYIADTLYFMYQEQSDFYRRFSKAIREAGFQGAICGGCWQASCWLGHLYNTLTDVEAGFIDRHNYSATPLNRPGAGNMSVGFQQVKNRPFNLSEWGGGPVAIPTVAVYGLGLQGWDAQCQFSSKAPILHNKVARGVNSCCDDFIQVAQFAALSRMVHRGDVKEGVIVANRKISIPGLYKGQVGLYEHFTLLGGGANTKEFSAAVPQAALMAGRVVLEYIKGPVAKQPVVENTGDYIDRQRRVVTSTTGQLRWDYSGLGFFVVDTPGTQAAVGHIAGQRIELGDVIVDAKTETVHKFYVVTLEREQPIAQASRLLIATFGRDANTGMMADTLYGDMVEGTEPLLLEPIRAKITFKGRNVKSVLPLDHAGRRRPGAVSLNIEQHGADAVFTVDGKTSRTMYYLVEM